MQTTHLEEGGDVLHAARFRHAAASTTRAGANKSRKACAPPVSATSDTAPDTPSEPSTTAAASAAAAPFAVALLWYLAHQIVGVGNDVIMKFVGTSLHAAQVVFLRFAFAALSMLPFMIANPSTFKTDRVPLHVARSVILLGAIGLYVYGLSIAPIAAVTTLNFTIPIFTLLLAMMFLSEKVDAGRWLATAAGFAGVAMVLRPSNAAFDPRWLSVLGSALLFAGLDVLNKVFIGKESFWARIFYTAAITAILAAVPAALVWTAPTAMQLGLLIVLGGGANLLLFCLLKAFSLVDVSALAPYRYLELLLSILVGYIFFAEIPATSTIAGALAIVPATAFITWKEQQSMNSKEK